MKGSAEMEHQTTLAQVPPIAVNPMGFRPNSTERESLAEIAHEARNMLAALGVCCDLLSAPGVLTGKNAHLSGDLKIVVAASRHLVEKLCALKEASFLSGHNIPAELASSATWGSISKKDVYWEELPPMPINDLAAELESNKSLLAALAGPAITVTVEARGGALPVHLNSEDLTRILVNLVKNSVEAMPQGGRILLSLREASTEPGQASAVILNVEDNGNGIPVAAQEKVFEPGYTTHSTTDANTKTAHRGQGLSITRSIIQSAGGAIRAANRDPVGACFQIELPVRTP
jgi:signal transduction histidine kinase